MINPLLLQIIETRFQIRPANKLINTPAECQLPGPSETSNDLALNLFIHSFIHSFIQYSV